MVKIRFCQQYFVQTQSQSDDTTIGAISHKFLLKGMIYKWALCVSPISLSRIICCHGCYTMWNFFSQFGWHVKSMHIIKFQVVFKIGLQIAMNWEIIKIIKQISEKKFLKVEWLTYLWAKLLKGVFSGSLVRASSAFTNWGWSLAKLGMRSLSINVCTHNN